MNDDFPKSSKSKAGREANFAEMLTAMKRLDYEEVARLAPHSRKGCRLGRTWDCSSLMRAVELNSVKCVEILIPLTDDLDELSPLGHSALALAMRDGTESGMRIARMLVSAGARSNAPDCWGKSVLMFAAERDDAHDIVSALARNAAKERPAGVLLETPLMLAARCGAARNIEALLPYSDIPARDLFKRTAADIAREHGNSEALDLIESYGARAEREQLRRTVQEPATTARRAPRSL